MATVEITKDNFRHIYETNDIVVLDFWAAWCGPCSSYTPIFEEVSHQFEDVVFGKVNTETEQEIAAHFSVRSIPTTIIIRQGYEIHTQGGLINRETLTDLVEKTKALNMDELKKQWDQEEEA